MGPFTNLTLDFDHKGRVLNMIFGLNEAGKSAALRGIKALLYGIEERTPDNFLHDNQSLRIGGHIQISDKSEISFIRRKGRKNTIFKPDNTPIDEGEIKRFLNNTTVELFDRLFGINHDELIRGGKNILFEQGNAGETLFSAGVGIPNLRQIIEGIKAEAEDLFKPRGKKRINQLIENFNTIKKEISNLELSGDNWTEFEDELRKLKDKRSSLSLQIESLRKELAHLERIKNSMPVVAKLKAYSKELEQIGEFVALPNDFPDRRIKLLDKRQYDASVLNDTVKKLALLKNEEQNIKIPHSIIKNEKMIDDFQQMLGSYLKAERDSKKISGEAEQLLVDAKKILLELAPGLPFEKIESIRLSKITKVKIRDTAKKYWLLSDKLKSKEADLKRNEAEINELNAKLQRTQKPFDIKELKAALKNIHSYGNLEEELRILSSKSLAEIKKAENALKRLPLYDGDMNQFETIKVPQDKTIDKFDAEFDSMMKKRDSLSKQKETIENKIRMLQAELKAFEISGNIPSESDLLEARQRRQKGWDLILKDWIYGKPDNEAVKEFAQQKPLHVAYEESVQAADEISDLLRREADKVAEKARLQSEINELEGEKSFLSKEQADIEKKLKDLQIEWENLWNLAGIKPLTPREMRSWLNSYHQLIELIGKIDEYKLKIEELNSLINTLKGELLNSLNSSGLPITDKLLTLENLKKIADEYVEQNDKAFSDRRLLEDRLDNLVRQRSNLEKDISMISMEYINLKPEFVEMLKNLGLPEDADISIIEAYLDRETELFAKIDERSGILKRLNDMEIDALEFASAFNNFTSQFAPKLKSINLKDAVIELSEILKKAKEDSARLAELKRQIREMASLCDNLSENIKNTDAELKKLCEFAKCNNIEDLEKVEEKYLKASQLNDKIKQLRDDLFHYSGTQSLDEFLKEIEFVDVDSIDSKIENLRDKIQKHEKELEESNTKIGELTNILQTMDGNSRAAQLREKAEMLLASIRKDTERYLGLQVAYSILRYEIDRYRERNQSPILKRASEIFRVLTINSFSGIEIDYRDDKPVIVCVRPSREIIGVESLSEGTCDQLYLALKLATLEKYLEENEPLPFIVDDILINFDDSRAESCLMILAELAEKTQVIFFTHHAHLIEIAKDTLPADKLKILRLPQKISTL